MHIQPFRALLPDMGRIAAPESFFELCKELFTQYVADGYYLPHGREALFLYEIVTERRSYAGVLACVDLEDYLEGHILKHEQTILAKEQVQQDLFMLQKAMIKPVLLAYPAVLDISQWTRRKLAGKAPLISIAYPEEKQEHRYYEISDPQAIRDIQELFLDHLVNAYIADGHHRCAAAANAYREHHEAPFRYLLCAFFPDSDLEIHNFNRVVAGLNGLTPETFILALQDLFDLRVLDHAEPPSAKHEMLLLLDEKWYYLKWRPEVLARQADPVLLDTRLLNELVLRNILGISNPRDNERISYVEGPAGMEALQRKARGEIHHAGFCLYPIDFKDMMALCDRGEVLPPKSTWFEPRMKTGLVVCPWNP